jgi:Protein of unknown function, DUF481
MTVGILRFFRAMCICLFASLVASLGVSAQGKRKDVVIMNNGDRFTGQVKRLQNGLLYLETDYVSSNIALDWNQVQSVESTAVYYIVMNNGRRTVGKIEKKSDGKNNTDDFTIQEATEELHVSSDSIATIETRKPTFWRQLQGSMDLGYSFTSGNSQSTLDADTNAAYTTPKWGAAVSFDSTFSGQSSTSKTNREDLQTNYSRFLNRNSFVQVLAGFLHSSQQDLTLRTTLGGGYGRYLKRTTHSNLSWLGGAVFAKESFDTTIGRPSAQNLEGVAGLRYSLTRFKFGQIDSYVLAFPGLTDSGRLRLTTNNSLTINLPNNFHWSFTLWDNFDSRPPATARKNELGISTGIGWSF